MSNETEKPKYVGRGGWRGGGKPKIVDGVRHTWTVPPDIHDYADKEGTKKLWEATRVGIRLLTGNIFPEKEEKKKDTNVIEKIGAEL